MITTFAEIGNFKGGTSFGEVDGRRTLADGSIYSGIMLDWMPHGMGSLRMPDGTSQFGVYKGNDDDQHSQRILRVADMSSRIHHASHQPCHSYLSIMARSHQVLVVQMGHSK